MKKFLPAFFAILILGIFVGAAYVKTQFKDLSPTPSPYPSLIQVNTNESPTTSPLVTISVTPPSLQETIPLTIIAPSPDTTVNTPTLTIKGKTVPRADISLNDKDLIADAAGNFSTNLTLDEGENLIIVTAVDENGNAAEKELVVYYEFPE